MSDVSSETIKVGISVDPSGAQKGVRDVAEGFRRLEEVVNRTKAAGEAFAQDAGLARYAAQVQAVSRQLQALRSPALAETSRTAQQLQALERGLGRRVEPHELPQAVRRADGAGARGRKPRAGGGLSDGASRARGGKQCPGISDRCPSTSGARRHRA